MILSVFLLRVLLKLLNMAQLGYSIFDHFLELIDHIYCVITSRWPSLLTILHGDLLMLILITGSLV